MSQYTFTEIRNDNNISMRFWDFRYIPGEKFPFHYDGHSRISIVLNGRLKEKAGQSEIFAQAFSVVVKPGDVWHSNEFGPDGARLLSVVFPPDFLSDSSGEPVFQHWQWYHSNQVARATSRYLQRLRLTDDPASETIDFLAALSPRPASHFTKATPDWLELVSEQIRDQPEVNYSVQELASSIGVHPVYMARAFRKYFDCGVKEYIHRNRLRNIISSLTDTKQPLVEVALESGYADQSHMSRFFKQATGMSPGAFREMVQRY